MTGQDLLHGGDLLRRPHQPLKGLPPPQPTPPTHPTHHPLPLQGLAPPPPTRIRSVTRQVRVEYCFTHDSARQTGHWTPRRAKPPGFGPAPPLFPFPRPRPPCRCVSATTGAARAPPLLRRRKLSRTLSVAAVFQGLVSRPRPGPSAGSGRSRPARRDTTRGRAGRRRTGRIGDWPWVGSRRWVLLDSATLSILIRRGQTASNRVEQSPAESNTVKLCDSSTPISVN